MKAHYIWLFVNNIKSITTDFVTRALMWRAFRSFLTLLHSRFKWEKSFWMGLCWASEWSIFQTLLLWHFYFWSTSNFIHIRVDFIHTSLLFIHSNQKVGSKKGENYPTCNQINLLSFEKKNSQRKRAEITFSVCALFFLKSHFIRLVFSSMQAHRINKRFTLHKHCGSCKQCEMKHLFLCELFSHFFRIISNSSKDDPNRICFSSPSPAHYSVWFGVVTLVGVFRTNVYGDDDRNAALKTAIPSFHCMVVHIHTRERVWAKQSSRSHWA